MKALVIEPFSGAAGDMIIGSLQDLGVDVSKITDAISAFELELELKEVRKCGIAAKKSGVRVYVKVKKILKAADMRTHTTILCT